MIFHRMRPRIYFKLLLHAVMNVSLMHLSLLCRLVVGGDFEGGLAACPLGGAFALYGGFLLHIRTCVVLI